MPRYLIERAVPGWTGEEIEAAGLRAKMCAPWFEGLHWIVSYLDDAQGTLFCIYDSPDEDSIRAHARFAGIPAGEIRVVSEIHPEDIEGDVDEATAAVEPRRGASAT